VTRVVDVDHETLFEPLCLFEYGDLYHFDNSIVRKFHDDLYIYVWH
jgi:hypothetical protein